MPKPISGVREEYKRYDAIDAPESLSQMKKDDRQASALRPHEREIAHRKTEELQSLVASLLDDKDDLDGSQHFTALSTTDGEFTVMKQKAMDNMSDKMSNIINLGRFVDLPVELVMDMQSLLQPAITSTTKQTLFTLDDETPEWSESIEAAKFATTACDARRSSMSSSTSSSSSKMHALYPLSKQGGLVHLRTCSLPHVAREKNCRQSFGYAGVSSLDSLLSSANATFPTGPSTAWNS
jgi:hypothetical protein